MKVVRCRCRACRVGLRTRRVSALVRMQVRAARRRAKQDIRMGRDPEVAVAIGYTD